MTRFCSLPEFLTADASLHAWRKRHLRWTVTGGLPGVSEGDLKQCYAAAWSFWQAVCGLTFEYTDNARTADVRMGAGPIDGSGRTLAWSELPQGSDSPLRQMYDTGERWFAGTDLSAAPRGLIPLLVTAAHEGGHAIGLAHSQDEGALMYPSLNVGTRGRPQSWDVREAVARYGPPRQDPLPPPGPTPASVLIDLARMVVVYPAGWTARQAG